MLETKLKYDVKDKDQIHSLPFIKSFILFFCEEIYFIRLIF